METKVTMTANQKQEIVNALCEAIKKESTDHGATTDLAAVTHALVEFCSMMHVTL